MAGIYIKSDDGTRIIETQAQPPIVRSFTMAELNGQLVNSKNRRDTKMLELAGAEAEVKAFEDMILEAQKLGVTE